MANSNKDEQCTKVAELFCDPCKNDGQNLPVEGFCVDCEEYLCEDCYKVHCRPSITRRHVLQGKQDMPKEQEFKSDSCTIHGDQSIEYYCEQHEEVCCPLCRVLSHGKCKGVKYIQDKLLEIDIKKEFANLQCKTKLLKNDINRTQYLVQTSRKAISVNHNRAKYAMDTFRTSVKKHVDYIESKVERELTNIGDEDERKITTHENTCEAMHFDVSTIESYIQAKVSKNRKCDAFIAMKRAQFKLRINHTNLEKIRSDNDVKRYVFTPDENFEELIPQLNSFGALNLNAQEKKSSLSSINLNARHAKDSHFCEITGLCLISESYIAAADKRNNNVKIININLNKITADVLLRSPPNDMTVVSDNKLAVTIPSEKLIQFLSVPLPHAEAINIEQSINVSGECHGIDFIQSNGKIIVTYCNSTKVEILNLDGVVDRQVNVSLYVPTKIAVIPNTSKALMAALGNTQRGMLMCIDFGNSNKDKFNISTRSIFSTVQGITNDRCGISSYICTKNKVLAISIDELHKNIDATRHSNIEVDTVLANGKVQDARSIAYCDRTFRLYIGTQSDKIQVYIVA